MFDLILHGLAKIHVGIGELIEKSVVQIPLKNTELKCSSWKFWKRGGRTAEKGGKHVTASPTWTWAEDKHRATTRAQQEYASDDRNSIPASNPSSTTTNPVPRDPKMNT